MLAFPNQILLNKVPEILFLKIILISFFFSKKKKKRQITILENTVWILRVPSELFYNMCLYNLNEVGVGL